MSIESIISYTSGSISNITEGKAGSMEPFEALLDIEQNCKTHAAQIPRQSVPQKSWLGIGFRSSEHNFVCPIGVVTEILQWLSVTPVPAQQPWFKGMANLRGRLLPITDLQGFVTGNLYTEKPLSRILVVAFQKAFYGFVVDQVIGIERFFEEEIKPADPILKVKAYLPYLEGAFERNHQPWFILNFESITKIPEFYHVLAAKLEDKLD